MDLAYNVKGGKLFFPPKQGGSVGAFTPGDSSKRGHPPCPRRILTLVPDIALSATPNVTSQASLEAHVIPNVSIFAVPSPTLLLTEYIV